MIETMKKISLIVILLALLLFIVGCEDTETTTEIFPDGSCRRIIKVESNSETIFGDPYPFPRDFSWTVNEIWVPVEEKEKNMFSSAKKRYVYSAEKRFASVSDLNAEFSLENKFPRPPRLDIRVNLEKRFAWFFTVYHYRETYRKFFPFDRVPLQDYFSPEELKILKTSLADGSEPADPKKKDELEEKFFTWISRAIFEDLYLILLDGVKQLQRTGLTPELIASQKEALFDATFNQQEFDLFEELPISELLGKYAKMLNQSVEVAQELLDRQKQAFASFEAKYRMIDEIIGDSYVNNVIMPGLITETNAGTVTGNKASWKLDDLEKFFITDYEMWVKSRRVNWWFVAIAVFIVLMAFAALIGGALGRRKRR